MRDREKKTPSNIGSRTLFQVKVTGNEIKQRDPRFPVTTFNWIIETTVLHNSKAHDIHSSTFLLEILLFS